MKFAVGVALLWFIYGCFTMIVDIAIRNTTLLRAVVEGFGIASGLLVFIAIAFYALHLMGAPL
jgi:hypothetical protein